jgi:hypothetical protein
VTSLIRKYYYEVVDRLRPDDQRPPTQLADTIIPVVILENFPANARVPNPYYTATAQVNGVIGAGTVQASAPTITDAGVYEIYADVIFAVGVIAVHRYAFAIHTPNANAITSIVRGTYATQAEVNFPARQLYLTAGQIIKLIVVDAHLAADTLWWAMDVIRVS